MKKLPWLKRVFGRPAAAAEPQLSPAEPVEVEELAVPLAATRPDWRSQRDGQAYLDKLRGKIGSLAAKFAAGRINRRQFEELYNHYQTEIRQVENMLRLSPSGDSWKDAVTEGQSILIRRRAAARLLGFAIYDNHSGLPIRDGGKFGVDPDLFVPMLSSYRSATQEIFGAGVRTMQIEGGRWLCFIPGRLTTSLMLFSLEPSGDQVKHLEQMHAVFEHANAATLEKPPVDPQALACLHEYYLSHDF